MDLREYRRLRGLKQSDVADAFGVSVPHVSQLEGGVVPFTLRLALRIEAWSVGEILAVELLEPEDAALLTAAIVRALDRVAA